MADPVAVTDDSGARRLSALPPESGRLAETDIAATLDARLVPGRNLLYCATFQLAWNEFQSLAEPEGIRFEGPSPTAELLRKARKITSDVLPPGSFVLKGGMVSDGVVEEIRREMQNRFPDSPFDLPEPRIDAIAVIYAYLERSLAFAEEFDRLRLASGFRTLSGVVPVNCFGVRRVDSNRERDRALAGQVSLLEYASDDSFILRLHTTSRDDVLILARIRPAATLSATLQAVEERLEKSERTSPVQLENGSSLVVPILSVGVRHQFSDLIGNRLTSGRLKGASLEEARQRVRFRLDERGARMASDAYLEVKSESSTHPPQLIFNEPFLLCLRRKNSKTPYLALWIANAELMERAK